MSDRDQASVKFAQACASLDAYWVLCKPRVVFLMLITSAVGMFLAAPGVPWYALFWGNLGIAMTAASAAAFNHVADQRIDAIMKRTAHRPLVKGVLTELQALLFASVLGLLGLALLFWKVNALCAILSFASLIGYAGIYTLYLKRATPYNIVIGGLAGASPPLLGWVAVTGHAGLGAWLLLLIIFFWTPPHFWALAIARKEEYAQAEIPMYPITHGVAATKKQIVTYSMMLLILTCLPVLLGVSGAFYGICALLLGGYYLYLNVRLQRSEDTALPMRSFRFSIMYLLLLFVALLIDHALLM